MRGGDDTGYHAGVASGSLSADCMVRVFDALERWISVDRLAEITCPTLLLAGADLRGRAINGLLRISPG